MMMRYVVRAWNAGRTEWRVLAACPTLEDAAAIACGWHNVDNAMQGGVRSTATGQYMNIGNRDIYDNHCKVAVDIWHGPDRDLRKLPSEIKWHTGGPAILQHSDAHISKVNRDAEMDRAEKKASSRQKYAQSSSGILAARNRKDA